VDLMESEELLIHSLVLKTTGILEQPCNTSLLQSTSWWASVTFSNAYLFD
jgi:hypothetical protein